MASSYRQQFEGEERASAYDETQYASGSYGDTLWQIEQRQLETVVSSMRSTHSRIDYLDFATGTGRILRFMEGKVDSARGIEISYAMAEKARHGLVDGEVLCTDITDPDAPIEGQYDLITAFRFVLNAEPSLRHAGLGALARRLRNDESLLVFNNHGNLLSLKALVHPLRVVRRRHDNWKTSGNLMTDRQIRELTKANGLEIISVMGCGILTGHVAELLPQKVATVLESVAARYSLVSRFGVNQMYVTRLAAKRHG